jgi:hypothetical protein
MKKIPAIFVLILIFTGPIAGAPASMWDDLIRSGAKGDEAFRAAGRAERVAAELSKGGAAGRALSHEAGEVADAAARSRRLQALLTATLHQPDPALLRQIQALAPAELEAAVVLGRGGRRLIEAVPDVAGRARMLRDGGADLVGAVGLHGDDLAREASRLDALVLGGKIPARIADQAALARFAEVMRAGDGGAWKFWQQYVKPHWGKWVAGGAFAAYLASPETFHDALGNLTKEGTRRVGEIVGAAVGGVIEGSAEGAKSAAGKVWQRFSAHYLHGPGAWIAWLGLALMCWVLGMLLPRTRRVCLAPLAWLFRKPKP